MESRVLTYIFDPGQGGLGDTEFAGERALGRFASSPPDISGKPACYIHHYFDPYTTQFDNFALQFDAYVNHTDIGTLAHSLRHILAQRLRMERTVRRWSQEALALSAGLNRTHVGAIERAEVSASIDTVNKLADALEVDAWCMLKDGNYLKTP